MQALCHEYYFGIEVVQLKHIKKYTETEVSENIYDLIREGEHQQQDFKFCINDSRKIAKSLVAFANTDGGRLLIGVKDNGSIAGVRSDEEYYMIEAAAKMFSSPAIEFSHHQYIVEGKTVFEVKVEPSNERPHFAKDHNNKWLAYVRVDDQNILANRIIIEVWKRQKSQKGVSIFFSKEEEILLNYLEKHNSISHSKFTKIARISYKKAERIIINFILIGVLEYIVTEKQITYRLNEEFDRDEMEAKYK